MGITIEKTEVEKFYPHLVNNHYPEFTEGYTDKFQQFEVVFSKENKQYCLVLGGIKRHSKELYTDKFGMVDFSDLEKLSFTHDFDDYKLVGINSCLRGGAKFYWKSPRKNSPQYGWVFKEYLPK